MPQAPRWNKKAQRIVIQSIGLPQNAVDVETPKEKKRKQQLIFEEGQWTR